LPSGAEAAFRARGTRLPGRSILLEIALAALARDPSRRAILRGDLATAVQTRLLVRPFARVCGAGFALCLCCAFLVEVAEAVAAEAAELRRSRLEVTWSPKKEAAPHGGSSICDSRQAGPNEAAAERMPAEHCTHAVTVPPTEADPGGHGVQRLCCTRYAPTWHESHAKGTTSEPPGQITSCCTAEYCRSSALYTPICLPCMVPSPSNT